MIAAGMGVAGETLNSAAATSAGLAGLGGATLASGRLAKKGRRIWVDRAARALGGSVAVCTVT